MLTLAHAADVHLDRAFTDAGLRRSDVRRRALRDAYLRILEFAESADALCFAGDLYEHENVTADTEALLVRTLGEFGKPVLLLPGNHDPHVAGSVYQRAEWPENVHVFGTSEPTSYELTPEVVIWGIAYTLRELRTEVVRQFRAPDDGRTHLLLLHGSVVTGYQGTEGDHLPVTIEELAATGAEHVLLGHYHNGRSWERATYPGSPEPLTWGERGTHAVNRVVVDEGKVTTELVPINETSFAEIEVDVSGAGDSGEIESVVREQIAGQIDRGRAIRVVLGGMVGQACEVRPAEIAEQVSDGFAEVIVVDSTEPPFDLTQVADEQTVRGRFVAKLLEQSETDPDRADDLREAAFAGLRALAGRKDLVRVD
jgi:DNA repair exonuclease SbcCD nuclease subunit